MILSILAAVVLTGAEPSAAGLAGRFVQVQDALPGQQPTYAGWTRAQLETEGRRLEDERPGIGGPVAMMAIGAALGAVDLIALFFGGLVALLGGNLDAGYIISVSLTAVVAIGLMVVAGILLKGLSKERAENTRRIDEVKSAIERLMPAPFEPPPNVPPAMQLPVPMQVRGPAPLIAVTLARF